MQNYGQYAHNLLVRGRLAAAQSEFPRAAMLAEQALAHFQALGLRSAVNQTLIFLGYIAWACGNYDEASNRLQGSLALASELPVKELPLWARNWLGWIACACGHDGQEALFQENVASAGDTHFSILVAWSLQGLGYLAYWRGETDQAVVLLSEGLAILEQVGWTIDRAFMLNNLARAVQAQGDSPRAAALWRESLVLSRDLGDRWKIAMALEGLAGLSAARRQPERAAWLYGAAEALREAIGVPLWPSLRAEYDDIVARVGARLGVVAFDAAWAGGRALPLDAAIDAAQDSSAERDIATPIVAPSGPSHP